jgi:chorismate mutase
MCTALQNARQQIDDIDRRFVELLARRQAIVDEITEVKADADRDVKDPDREAELLDRLRTKAREHGLPPDLVEDIYEQILEYSVERQRRQRNGTSTSDTAPNGTSHLRLVGEDT